MLGLKQVPNARRAGKWLSGLGTSDVKGLWNVAVELAGRVAPSIIVYEIEKQGYVPLLIGGTGIEVDEKVFEWTRKDDNGNQGYWLHGTFLGGLWSAGQLQPGGGRVTLNWHKLLHWTAGMIPQGTPVWLRADNAYYKKELVRECARQGWDYSISLTHDDWCNPVLEQLKGLPDVTWTEIKADEEATLIAHRPNGWDRMQHYLVTRRRVRNDQFLLMPQHTVTLVSPRNDLPVEELIHRHGTRKSRENIFKGSLQNMGLHHPPCLSYRANQAFYALAQIAQTLLREVQYTSMPKSSRRLSIRDAIRFVM